MPPFYLVLTVDRLFDFLQLRARNACLSGIREIFDYLL